VVVSAVAQEALVVRPVFTVAGVEYTWGDVVVDARLRGAWDDVEHDAGRGLAALAQLHARDEELDPDEVDAAAAEFRYERDLLSADELEAWLDRWDLSFVEWGDWVAQSLARVCAAAWEGHFALERIDPDELQTAASIEAVCSGALVRWARHLALRASFATAQRAAAPAVDESDPPPARGLLALAPDDWSLAVAKVGPLAFDVDGLLAQGVGSAEIEREVGIHRTDWVTFDCRVLRLPQAGMAREAIFCLRDDGLSLEAVAGRARTQPETMRTLLEDLSPELQTALLAAMPGDVIGPVAAADGYAVVLLDSKRAPDASDERVAERAGERAMERAARRELGSQVKWHEQL